LDRVIIEYTKPDIEHFLTPMGGWIESETICAAIIYADSVFNAILDTSISRTGEISYYHPCDDLYRVEYFYPQTGITDTFGYVKTACDYYLEYGVIYGNNDFILLDFWVPTGYGMVGQVDRGDTAIGLTGVEGIWGPLDDGRFIIDDTYSGKRAIYSFKSYNPRTQKRNPIGIPDSSRVFLITPDSRFVVGEPVKVIHGDSEDTYIRSNYKQATSLLMKTWDLSNTTCDTIGCVFMADSLYKALRQYTYVWQIGFGTVYSLDYIEVVADTYSFDIKPRVIIDTSGVDAIFGVDSLPVTRPLRYDSRLYIDLDNEPHLRTRRLGIHEND